MKKLLKQSEGFTLIEMSIVLFIISALLLLFIPNLSDNRKSANDTGSAALTTVLQTQVEMYTMDNGKPGSFADLGEKYLTQAQRNELENFTLSSDGIVSYTPQSKE